ncbi:DUF1775 domain-containing protein [Streptomyces sp. NPDC091972]|uniref:DUF1775 domain-containing protein n=1 Tax=Streptomyces sp. NPDC091972 TaxID=3366007 RepID=UPI0037F68192
MDREGESPASKGGTTPLVWTATAGHELRPDEHRYSDVRVGALPDEPSATFGVFQTYSDGSSANWNELQRGDKMPDFAAPVLVLDAEAAKAEQSQQDEARRRTTAAAPARAAADAWSGGGVTSRLPWTAAEAAVVGACAVAVRRRLTLSKSKPSRR